MFFRDVENVIRNHFHLFFLFGLLWVASAMSFMLWRRSRRGPHFPRFADVILVFREEFASGHSDKSWLTRLGGAHNCLTVAVTDDEVWVKTLFPFSAFAGIYDLEHRIPRSAITSLKRNGKWVYLEYRLPDQSARRLNLRLRKVDEFISALPELHNLL